MLGLLTCIPLAPIVSVGDDLSVLKYSSLAGLLGSPIQWPRSSVKRPSTSDVTAHTGHANVLRDATVL